MPQFPRSIDTGSFGFTHVRFLCLGLVVLFVLYLAATMVPAGHVGVKDFFGNVSPNVIPAGVHFVLPFTRVVKMSIKTQELFASHVMPHFAAGADRKEAEPALA